MSALVVMILLGFFLVIAASLTIWAALSLNQHPPAPAGQREPTAARPRQVARPPSNDDVRGARAKVTARAQGESDAFERFLHAEPRRDETKF